MGERTSNYHLRDWLVCRQRYWGAPTPMIYCETCAKEGKSWFTHGKPEYSENSDNRKTGRSDAQNVRNSESSEFSGSLIHPDQSDWDHYGWYPEENLPVLLLDITDYKPQGEGKGPLDNHPEFYEAKCPACGAKAKRETDVLDTFVDSSWYFLRYPSVGSKTADTEPFDQKITRNWLPVDLYFGGAEHSVLHLMYSRFVWMALRDAGLLGYKDSDLLSKGQLVSDWDEPFPRFFAHGLMIKDGAKMSKSRGNVVNPDEYVEKFGADTLRLYLMFMGPMDGYPDFRDTGIEGMRRFIEKVWSLFQFSNFNFPISSGEKLQIKMHQTIKKVDEDIQNFKYNTAIAAIMEYVNLLREVTQNKRDQGTRNREKEKENNQIKDKNNTNSEIWSEALKTLALLLAPFAPHITEEVWVNILGQKFSIHNSNWPTYDPKLVKEETVTFAIQVNGRLRATIEISSDDSKNKDVVIEKAKSDEKVKSWLKDKKIIKEIFVPGRILNIVTSG